MKTQQNQMKREFLPVLAATVAILTSAVTGVAAADAPPNRTLGFVVRDWMPAVYESKFIDECPSGLDISNDEIWWRSLSKAELNPEVIKDDPPLLTVEGATSFGVNLDGNVDGSATPKSCRHDNFSSPAGVPGIDNQLYRLIGCVYGFRDQGVIEINANEMRRTSGLAMILIEVTDVDDARNDDDVTVTFYRSIDQFPLDSSGQVIPYSSYRIDHKDDGPRYGDSLKASIVDGVIQTSSGDVRLPYYGNYNYLHPVIRDMQMTLEITDDGADAKGMVAGYYDLEQYLYHTGGLGPVITTGNFSCPAFFEAAKRMADGYPDPETGECTHISSAFEVKAHAAFVVHPEQTSKMETAER